MSLTQMDLSGMLILARDMLSSVKGSLSLTCP